MHMNPMQRLLGTGQLQLLKLRAQAPVCSGHVDMCMSARICSGGCVPQLATFPSVPSPSLRRTLGACACVLYMVCFCTSTRVHGCFGTLRYACSGHVVSSAVYLHADWQDAPGGERSATVPDVGWSGF